MRLTQRSRVIGLLAVGLVCLAGCAAPMQRKAGKSGGGDSLDTYVTWPSAPDARGYSERNVTLTVNHDPGGATSNYYWASQFWFNSAANGGYTGLQTGAQRPDGTVGKMAIFSIWGDPSTEYASPGSGASCQAFGGEGNGMSCHLSYDWVAGRGYQLQVAVVAGTDRWQAWVIDTTTGIRSEIGVLEAPSGAQWLSSSSVVFSEQYVAPPGCPIEYASATFDHITSNEGAAAGSTADTVATSYCRNEAATLVQGGVLHEINLPTTASPPA